MGETESALSNGALIVGVLLIVVAPLLSDEAFSSRILRSVKAFLQLLALAFVFSLVAFFTVGPCM